MWWWTCVFTFPPPLSNLSPTNTLPLYLHITHTHSHTLTLTHPHTCTQDAVTALYQDCNYQSLSRNKNLENFKKRCECDGMCLYPWIGRPCPLAPMQLSLIAGVSSLNCTTLPPLFPGSHAACTNCRGLLTELYNTMPLIAGVSSMNCTTLCQGLMWHFCFVSLLPW